jgi:hypothetical protein
LEGDWGYASDTLSNAFFGDNSIASIPRSFSTFAALVWLNLDNNNIEDLRAESLPPNLVTLSLNANLLRLLPPSLASLKDLTWLYLRGNDISRLELPNFKSANLEMIDLSDNTIESVSYAGTANNTLRIKDLNLSGKGRARPATGPTRFPPLLILYYLRFMQVAASFTRPPIAIPAGAKLYWQDASCRLSCLPLSTFDCAYRSCGMSQCKARPRITMRIFQTP